MSAEYELVPLDCPTCGAAVAADGEDELFYCTACRNGYAFDLGSQALRPVEVAFLAASDVAAEVHLPFWLLPAEIRMRRRGRDKLTFSGLMNLFANDSRPAGPGPGEGTFAVPAFHCSLDSVTALTRAYSERASDPRLAWGELIGERLIGGRYGVSDARKLAHYALIAGEVDRPGTLENLRYEIDFGEPRLLGVPFVRDHGGQSDGALRDALFRISV